MSTSKSVCELFSPFFYLSRALKYRCRVFFFFFACGWPPSVTASGSSVLSAPPRDRVSSLPPLWTVSPSNVLPLPLSPRLPFFVVEGLREDRPCVALSPCLFFPEMWATL